jgi:hypothetical protein
MSSCIRFTAPVIGALLALSQVDVAQAGTPKPRGTSATNTVPVVAQVEIPQSVFLIPSQPSEGRNPFFPQSSTGFQAVSPTLKPKESVLDTSSFVLNGITSPPKRTAMINGRTFEPGESGEVKLPSGARTLIKVEEIKGESAIILVAGQRREVKLRAGL